MSKQRLKEVMSVQSETYKTEDMDRYLYEEYLTISHKDPDNYTYDYDKGNTYITKGKAKSYPCVIAHTDTVHDIHKNLTVFEGNGSMFAMDMSIGVQVGIGGDDKVGIYVALEMLRKKDILKVAFFRDEEHGCLGSQEANMSFFKNVEFVLQCDRQGYKDFVNTIYGTDLFDDKFSEAVAPILNKYDKEETTQGGLTDVYQLVENGLDVCVANLSCGYYRPHSDDEIIILEDVFNTRDTVEEIIDTLGGKIWTNDKFMPYVPYKKSKSKSKGKGKVYTKAYEDWAAEVDARDKWEDDSREDWWDGDRYDQSTSVWKSVASKNGVTIEEYERKYDSFDDDAMDHIDLDTCCSNCESDEIMYDKSEDADWCFVCEDYTNTYQHFLIEDEHDNRPVEAESNSIL